MGAGAFNKDPDVVKMILFSLSSNINHRTGKRVSLFSLLKLYSRFSKVGGGWGVKLGFYVSNICKKVDAHLVCVVLD